MSGVDGRGRHKGGEKKEEERESTEGRSEVKLQDKKKMCCSGRNRVFFPYLEKSWPYITPPLFFLI